MTNGERRQWPFVRWLGLGKSLEEIVGLIRLAEAKQRATTARAELCGQP